MSRMFPETEKSEAAERGTAAHELAATMIHAGARAGFGMPVRETVVGTEATNGIMFDDDLFDAAAEYAGYAIKLIVKAKIFGGPNLGIEARVEAPSVHHLSRGTVDFHLFHRGARELIIMDFKNGFGVVEVFENWQLANYAAAVIDTLGLRNDPAYAGLKIRFVIVQPNAIHRDGPIREWLTDTVSIQWMFDQLAAGAARAFELNPETRSGPHCRYCRARLGCKAAIDAGPHLYEMVADINPVNLTVAQMAAYLTTATRATAHLKSLSLAFEEQLKAAAREGKQIPGYRVEQSFGREVWAKPFAEVARLGDMLGQDLRKKEAITPRQARALGLDDSLVTAYSKKDQTGPKLVADDSKLARKVFSL